MQRIHHRIHPIQRPQGLGPQNPGKLGVMGPRQCPQRRNRVLRTHFQSQQRAVAQLLSHLLILRQHALVHLEQLPGVDARHVHDLHGGDLETVLNNGIYNLSHDSLVHQGVGLDDREGAVGEARRGREPAGLVEEEADLAVRRRGGVGPVACVLGAVSAIQGSEGAGGLLLCCEGVCGPDQPPPLLDGAVGDQLHGDDGAAGHEIGEAAVERLAPVLCVELLGVARRELNGAELSDPKAVLLDGVDDAAGLEVRVGLDERERLLLLGLQRRLGELVSKVRHHQLSRVYVYCRPDEKVVESDTGILATPQELPPVLQIVHLD
mmetsp:Transcript_31831/g.62146  ORF Transcript_31831/g.62146 Transcript_31831/m.62146 type:complete len:321 (+) Transcript_31831:87-1049(+)